VTGRHHRGTPLIRLLARLSWQRDPAALQVGQLRHAARDVVLTGGLLADPDQAEPARRSWRTEAPTAPRDNLPLQREVIHLIPAAPARPSGNCARK
jgi:hypothetical protein